MTFNTFFDSLQCTSYLLNRMIDLVNQYPEFHHDNETKTTNKTFRKLPNTRKFDKSKMKLLDSVSFTHYLNTCLRLPKCLKAIYIYKRTFSTLATRILS